MRLAFVPVLRPGVLPLEPSEAHHVRDVLRMAVGDPIGLFDAAGNRATAVLTRSDRDGVDVRVDQIEPAQSLPAGAAAAVTVATAVPKNERADWLVEKLSEVGVARWVPLQTARSVVHPSGANKFDRWRRIAIESAKQCRRSGVMEIGELTRVEALPVADPQGGQVFVLSTRPGSSPLAASLNPPAPVGGRTVLIGPEGGWTDDELAALTTAGAREVSLTPTILRIETAAVLAAGLIACGVGAPPPIAT